MSKDIRSTPILPDREMLIEPFECKGFVVPKFFIWNGASIPRLFWITTGAPFWPQYKRAGCLHDYLYIIQPFSRERCDKLFLKLLVEDGVSKYNRTKMYTAVRMFGGKYWRKKTKDRIISL